MYNVSCILFNKCLYFSITWLDTFWTDLVYLRVYLYQYLYLFKRNLGSGYLLVDEIAGKNVNEVVGREEAPRNKATVTG